MNESGRTYCSREWVTKRTSPLAMASDQYVRKRHGKMFDETWKWAGTIGYGKKQRCSRS